MIFFRAAYFEPEMISTWKLLGDSCTLLHCLPPSMNNCQVPHRLIDNSVQSLDEIVEITKLEILQLGARFVLFYIPYNDTHQYLHNKYLYGNQVNVCCIVTSILNS